MFLHCSHQFLISRNKIGLPKVHQLDSDVERDRDKVVEKEEKNEAAKKRSGRLEGMSEEINFDVYHSPCPLKIGSLRHLQLFEPQRQDGRVSAARVDVR